MLAAIALSGLLLTTSATAQTGILPGVQMSLEDRAYPPSLLRESWRVYNRSAASRENRFESYFLRHNQRFPANSYLTMRPDQLYGLGRYELTQIQSAFAGLELGAAAGLFGGAVGETFGLWDEETSWAIMGAMGVLGAILGGTKGYNDPNFRYRYRWTDE